ncbi:MAG: hypothetical protein ACRDY0_06835 [Acidimicrobiales bacterium]
MASHGCTGATYSCLKPLAATIRAAWRRRVTASAGWPWAIRRKASAWRTSAPAWTSSPMRGRAALTTPAGMAPEHALAHAPRAMPAAWWSPISRARRCTARLVSSAAPRSPSR